MCGVCVCTLHRVTDVGSQGPVAVPDPETKRPLPLSPSIPKGKLRLFNVF